MSETRSEKIHEELVRGPLIKQLDREIETLSNLSNVDIKFLWGRPALPDLTAMQERLNEHARTMAAAMRYSFPVVFMAGDEGVPLADQEIPAEGTE